MRSPEEHPDLLPWHVTGALPPAHAKAIEDHLSWCAPCAREARALASLRKSLVRQGLMDHPPSQEIISMEIGSGLDPLRRELVEAHIADCGECQEDLDASRRAHHLQRDIEAGAADGPASGAAGATRWGRRRLTVAAAGAILALSLPTAAYLSRPLAPRPPVATESITFMPPVRGADQDRALVGDGPWSIRAVLPSDAPGGGYLFSVSREEVGFRWGSQGPVFADGDGCLRLQLGPLPPGTGYVLLVWPTHGLESEALEYPFRVMETAAGLESRGATLVGLLRRWRRSP